MRRSSRFGNVAEWWPVLIQTPILLTRNNSHKSIKVLRYFFHTADGSRERDVVGVELPALPDARHQAITFLGECIKDDPNLLEHHDFRVEVTDTLGELLLTVITIAVSAPTTGHT
jgi:hypothetical protein